MADLTDLDTAWLAGYLEGEGCFTLSKGRYIRVVVASTDRDILNRVALLTEGVVGVRRRDKRQPNAKTVYHIEITGDRARTVATLVYPFMGLRRQKRIREIFEIDPKAELGG